MWSYVSDPAPATRHTTKACGNKLGNLSSSFSAILTWCPLCPFFPDSASSLSLYYHEVFRLPRCDRLEPLCFRKPTFARPFPSSRLWLCSAKWPRRDRLEVRISIYYTIRASDPNFSAQFSTLTATSACNQGDNACVKDQFAQCVGGKFSLTSCGGGTV